MPATEQRQRTITVVSEVLTAIAVAAFVAFDPGTLGTRIREAIGAGCRRWRATISATAASGITSVTCPDGSQRA